MVTKVENLLLNETEDVKSAFIEITSVLKDFDIEMKDSNSELMFANHLIMLVKRLVEGKSIPTYYFEDGKSVDNVSRKSIAIAETALKNVFKKYNKELSYTEILLCAMYIELLGSDKNE